MTSKTTNKVTCLSSITTGVERRSLDNGLRVLVKEQRAAPVTAVVAHVRVGYFNEPDEWNGISHVVEHMLFKGTRKRPGKEQIASDVRALGGSINAGTYYEDTTYYITVPSRHTESAVEILSDMVRNSLIDPDELAKELEVIIQESKQKRDNPRAMLFETMYARAFDHHRIRRWRIGEDETLRAFRHDDLAKFIAQTYVPENMVLSIVGDIAPEESLRIAETHWGDQERIPLQNDQSPEEPERRGFRYHRMTGDIQQRLLVFGFPAPPVLSDEAPALMILDSVLSDGRSSRFYRALKEERRLVNSASTSYEGFERLGLFTLSAEAQSDDPLAAERGLFEEIARLIEQQARPDELERIKTRLDSRWVFAQEEVMGLARTLTSYEVLGGYELADAFRARLEAVQVDDLPASAAKYLSPDRATLVEYLPDSAASPHRSDREIASELTTVWDPPAIPQGFGSARTSPAPTQTAPPSSEAANTSAITVRSLPGGATLLHRLRTDLPVTAVHVLFPGGRSGEKPETAGITNLLLKSIQKGTASHTAEELARKIERLGTSIGTTLGADYLGLSMKVLSHRAREGFAFLKEVITAPTFPSDEVEKEKESIYAEIRRQRDSMFSRALDLFHNVRFGDHPYGLSAIGQEEAVSELKDADIRAWHSRWFRSEGTVVAVVGSLSVNDAVGLFTGAIPDGNGGATESTTPIAESSGERAESVERQQTASVMGFDGASITHDDRHALDLLAEVTSGLAGRFFQAVRGDNALAYAVTSFHRPRQTVGYFGTYTATSPDKESLAREIILEECARLAKEPVSENELRDAKAAIHGEYAIHTQTFSAQAAELAVNHLYGLPLDEPDRYLARIDSVTASDLMEAAQRYLRPDRYWLGIVRGTAGT